MWSNMIVKRLICPSRLDKSSYIIAKFSKCLKSCSKQDNVICTQMLVQEGSNIYELPIIIRIISDFVKIIEDESKWQNFTSDVKSLENANSKVLQLKKQKDDVTAKVTSLFIRDPQLSKSLEIEKVNFEIDSLIFSNEADSMLKSIIHTEVNSKVALKSLRKIIEVERKYKIRKTSTFVIHRHKLVIQLMEMIIRAQDNETIIETFSLLLKDRFVPTNSIYKELIINEAIARSTNGNFTIEELMIITKILSTFREAKYRESIDYFWVGFIQRKNEINSNQLLPLFKLLPHMKQSRSILQTILEKKLIEDYEKLSVFQMTELLSVFQNDLYSAVVLKCATKWANAQLSSVSKYDLLEFIECLGVIKCVNCTIEKAIEKALQSKKLRGHDYALITAVANYCMTVHLRNTNILNIVAEYFDRHMDKLPIISFLEIIGTFGLLNFKSNNDFWIKFEDYLDKKFLFFDVDQILYIIISCACIGKYFPKYMERILSAEFLERLHWQNNDSMIQYLRSQLYLLDIAMTLECPTYKGPLLYSSSQMTTKLSNGDIRIVKILIEIENYLVKLAGNKDKLSTHVSLNKMSQVEMYALDAVIHKEPKSKLIDIVDKKNENTALLIQLPEYYCWNSTKVFGPQALKIRLLRKLGLRVMLLDYETLCSLQKRPVELEKYLTNSFKTAFDAL